MNEPKWQILLKKNWILLILQVVIVLLAISLGYLGHWLISKNQGELSLLKEARQILVENTIYEVPSDSALEYGMIQGMVSTINDPYTVFVEPAQAEVQSDELTGSFGGIGVRLERDLDAQWRIYPLPDSPAKQAGLLDGDLLMRIGELIVTKDSDEVSIIAQLRGPVEDIVEIEVLRNEQSLIFTIQRQTINLPSVTWNLVPDFSTIGMLHINRIAETTTDEIVAGIDEMTVAGAKAFILDLRDNGGGLVETGVDIAKLFLVGGDIIHQQFKDEEIKIYAVDEPGHYSNVPLVVWINGYTASAAEIIAGSLSNSEMITLIGSPTYGKTTIQYVFTLQDNSSLHVTSGHWWIPGVDFPLIPDIMLEEGKSEIEWLEISIGVLEG